MAQSERRARREPSDLCPLWRTRTKVPPSHLGRSRSAGACVAAIRGAPRCAARIATSSRSWPSTTRPGGQPAPPVAGNRRLSMPASTAVEKTAPTGADAGPACCANAVSVLAQPTPSGGDPPRAAPGLRRADGRATASERSVLARRVRIGPRHLGGDGPGRHRDLATPRFDEFRRRTRLVIYLRDLLVALEVLPPITPSSNRVSPWLDEAPRHTARRPGRANRSLRPLARSAQAAHQGTSAANLTARCSGQAVADDDCCGHEVLGLARGAPRRRSVPLAQGDLDLYVAEQPREAESNVAPFVRWLVRSGLTQTCELPTA